MISPALAAHPLTCSLHPDSHHISSRILCSSLGKAHSCLIHINFSWALLWPLLPLLTSTFPLPCHIKQLLLFFTCQGSSWPLPNLCSITSSLPEVHPLPAVPDVQALACLFTFFKENQGVSCLHGSSSPLALAEALALSLHMSPKAFLHQEPTITGQQPSLASSWSSWPTPLNSLKVKEEEI